MTLLDTSVLLEALAGERPLASTLETVIGSGERLALCTPVLYEWLRGPRTDVELASQEELLPGDAAWPFGATEAVIASRLYRRVRRARQRDLDLAIAACALARGVSLWTLNIGDFGDIPGLSLYDPAAPR